LGKVEMGRDLRDTPFAGRAGCALPARSSLDD